MLATVINALAVQSVLERCGLQTRVQSAIPMTHGLRALHPPARHPPHGEGAGRDLRRRHRQPVLHDRHRGGAARGPRWAATRCSRAPRSTASIRPIRRRTRAPSAYDRLTYQEVLPRDLRVMDASAISLARENAHSDHRVFHAQPGRVRRSRVRRRDLHHRSLRTRAGEHG